MFQPICPTITHQLLLQAGIIAGGRHGRGHRGRVDQPLPEGRGLGFGRLGAVQRIFGRLQMLDKIGLRNEPVLD